MEIELTPAQMRMIYNALDQRRIDLKNKADLNRNVKHLRKVVTVLDEECGELRYILMQLEKCLGL